MTPWHTLQRVEKLSLISQLNTIRMSLLEKSRAHRAAKSSKKRKKKEITFKTQELREFFNDMPDEMKKFVGG